VSRDRLTRRSWRSQ